MKKFKTSILSTLFYAKIYLKSMINFPSNVKLQNVQSLCKTSNKRNPKENQGNLNLKLNYLNNST